MSILASAIDFIVATFPFSLALVIVGAPISAYILLRCAEFVLRERKTFLRQRKTWVVLSLALMAVQTTGVFMAIITQGS